MNDKRSILILICLCIGLTLMVGTVSADHTPDGEKDIKNLTEDSINKENPGYNTGIRINPGVAVEGTWVYLTMDFQVEYERYEGGDLSDSHPVPTRVEWEIWVDGNRTHQIGGVFDPKEPPEYGRLERLSGLNGYQQYRLPIPEQTDGDVNITVTGATFDRTINLKTKSQIDSPLSINVTDGIEENHSVNIIGAVVSPAYEGQDWYDDFRQSSNNRAYGVPPKHWLFLESNEPTTFEMNDQTVDTYNRVRFYPSDESTSWTSCSEKRDINDIYYDPCTQRMTIPESTDKLIPRTVNPGDRWALEEDMPEAIITDPYLDFIQPGSISWGLTTNETANIDNIENVSADEKTIVNNQIDVYSPTLEDIRTERDQIIRDKQLPFTVVWEENPYLWEGVAEIYVNGNYRTTIHGSQELTDETTPVEDRRVAGGQSINVPDTDSVTVEARIPGGSSDSITVDVVDKQSLKNPDESTTEQIDVPTYQYDLVVDNLEEDAIVDFIPTGNDRFEQEDSFYVNSSTEYVTLDDPFPTTYDIIITGDEDVETHVIANAPNNPPSDPPDDGDDSEPPSSDPPDDGDDDFSDEPPAPDPPDDGDDPEDSPSDDPADDSEPLVGNPSSDGAGPGFGIGIVMIAIIVLIGVRRR